MTTKQRKDLPDDEEVTAADRLIVESPTTDRPDRGARVRAGAEPAAERRRDFLGRAVPPAVTRP